MSVRLVSLLCIWWSGEQRSSFVGLSTSLKKCGLLPCRMSTATRGLLNRALSEAGIAGIGKDQFDKWKKDYIQGFFDGLIGNVDLGWFGSFSKNPHVLGILDGADSAWRYVKDKENK